MRSCKLLGIALLATVSAFLAPASIARSEDALKSAPDAIFTPFMREKQIPALIVAVSQGGQRSYFGYGGAEHPPLAADTILEVGSITKVLTAILFAEAVVDGLMAPDGSIQRWMPQAIQLPWKTRHCSSPPIGPVCRDCRRTCRPAASRRATSTTIQRRIS